MNNVYSGSRACPGPRFRVSGVWNQPQGVQESLIGCPFRMVPERQRASAPLGHLEALRQNRKIQLHNISNTTVKHKYIDICQFPPTRFKLSDFYNLLDNYQIAGMSRNKSGVSGIQVYQEYDFYWNILGYIKMSGHHSHIVIIIRVRYAMSDVR